MTDENLTADLILLLGMILVILGGLTGFVHGLKAINDAYGAAGVTLYFIVCGIVIIGLGLIASEPEHEKQP